MYRWGSRSPQGGRGLKRSSLFRFFSQFPRRSPQGGRGLKRREVITEYKPTRRSPQGGRGL
ncbi:hypothetical protein HMPREF3038_02700, partial [Akkermansia sp. KLE1797]